MIVLGRHKRDEHRDIDVSILGLSGDCEPNAPTCLDIQLLRRPIEGSSIHNIINLVLEYGLVLWRHLALADHEVS